MSNYPDLLYLNDRINTAFVLDALQRQLTLDLDSPYWADRQQRGCHHPDEIAAWLGSLLDGGWTP